MTQAAFVQIGASRDKSDSYVACAKRRNMRSILFETADFLEYRRKFKCPEFDEEIALEDATNVNKIIGQLTQLDERPAIILPGFERYVDTAFELTSRLASPEHFCQSQRLPLDKFEQRIAIHSAQCNVSQPGFQLVTLPIYTDSLNDLEIHFPAVIKPVDSGGGLGVFKVENMMQCKTAVQRLTELRNYGGHRFNKILIEEFVDGQEYSIQGIAKSGKVDVLTCCHKVIVEEASESENSLNGFRERGHIAFSHLEMPQLATLAEQCVNALGYLDGPFHIDAIASTGELVFIEIGYRLSGAGLVQLVQLSTGRDWALESFDWLLNRYDWKKQLVKPFRTIGQCLAKHTDLSTVKSFESHCYSIDYLPFEPIALDDRLATSLEPELSRHSGFAARIRALGATVDEVKSVLLSCCPSLNNPKFLLERS